MWEEYKVEERKENDDSRKGKDCEIGSKQ